MTGADKSLARTAATLRREFDLSFAQPPATELAQLENFLAVRIGGESYAMRLTEIAGLYADRRIVPLPSPVPELLGTAGFRGQIAPVFDLALLLGYHASAASRWLALARGRDVVALAFDAFEAQLMIAPERVLASAAGERRARPHVHGAVQVDGAPRPIVHLASVLDDIHQRVEATHLKKER